MLQNNNFGAAGPNSFALGLQEFLLPNLCQYERRPLIFLRATSVVCLLKITVTLNYISSILLLKSDCHLSIFINIYTNLKSLHSSCLLLFSPFKLTKPAMPFGVYKNESFFFFFSLLDSNYRVVCCLWFLILWCHFNPRCNTISFSRVTLAMNLSPGGFSKCSALSL